MNLILAGKSLFRSALTFASDTDEPFYITAFTPSIYSEEKHHHLGELISRFYFLRNVNINQKWHALTFRSSILFSELANGNERCDQSVALVFRIMQKGHNNECVLAMSKVFRPPPFASYSLMSLFKFKYALVHGYGCQMSE